MCIIHDLSLHYLFQNIIEAFDQSKMISAYFLRRVGCLICTCKKDIYYDSKTIISTQRALYQWFEDSLADPQRPQVAVERLAHFKPIIDEFRQNGHIDSGTKITFLSLLRDLDSLNFSKLRRLSEQMSNKKKLTKRNIFFVKLVKLKFDLKLCSVKEFAELISKIDNCAIKYIQLTNKCKIVMRDTDRLSLKNFMGTIEATVEAKNEKNLYKAELALKRLADAVHYRLAKQIPSCDTILGGSTFKFLLQSPPDSKLTTPNDTSIELSTSYNTTTTTTTTTNTSQSSKNNLTTTTSSTNNNHINTTTTTNTDQMSECLAKGGNVTFDSNSSTLNGEDQYDSFYMNNDSVGNTTPMTSSPMSSSSNNSPFKFKLDEKPQMASSSKTKSKSKKSKTKSLKDNKQNNHQQQQQIQPQSQQQPQPHPHPQHNKTQNQHQRQNSGGFTIQKSQTKQHQQIQQQQHQHQHQHQQQLKKNNGSGKKQDNYRTAIYNKLSESSDATGPESYGVNRYTYNKRNNNNNNYNHNYNNNNKYVNNNNNNNNLYY
jgi:hypothetical protein